MQKTGLLLGIFFMLTAVMLGAFGAHGLKEIIEPSSIQTFKTGVFYQFVHGLSILIFVIFMKIFSLEKLKHSIILFTIGILFFSGSLYLLSIKSIIETDISFLGPITPIGGLFFIIAWLLALMNILKSKEI